MKLPLIRGRLKKRKWDVIVPGAFLGGWESLIRIWKSGKRGKRARSDDTMLNGGFIALGARVLIARG